MTNNIISLDGVWALASDGDPDAIPANVPGCVHLDLLAAGHIPDPFFRDNEKLVQWVSEREWTYTRDFDIPLDFLKEESVLLRCEGLDTLATVIVNGKALGTADNMFRVWEFNVKRLLHYGSNHIEIRFATALAYTRGCQQNRYIHAWQSREEGANYIRKEACNYGWDWGPKLITCGIWKSIQIEACSTPRLSDVSVTQKHDSQSKSVELLLDVSLRDSRIRRSRRTISELTIVANLRNVNKGGIDRSVAPLAPEGNPIRIQMMVTSPDLWWPRSLGCQPLYQLRVELHDAHGNVLDIWERRIGLRTLRLERFLDEWGERFQFTANGVSFFAKGANWIPADPFPTRVTCDQYRHLLESAADANMNMIRVWGGGIYEQESFYDLCDELGLCVWQDFMFACACYPTFDRAFMRNVRVEAEQQVRRLRHRACLALWCGNNELEQGICGPRWTEHQMPWKEYAKLFDRLLPDVISNLDPDRDYWPGSPHTPAPNRLNCNSPNAGDAHLWSVWHSREPFEWYRTAFHRFCSEFGFQSFPEPKTIEAFAPNPEDKNISSYMMDFHQRSWIGNGVIMSYMLDWFRQPRDFESFVWMSQILQGLAMKYAVEHWRRQMPRSMGALYWQLNDTWPGPSWSSIDYFGRWKALHFMARRFFAPVLISLVEMPGECTVEVWVTSDLREEVHGTLHLIATNCAGRELLRSEDPITIQPQTSSLVLKFPVDAITAPEEWGSPSTHPLHSPGGLAIDNTPAPRDLLVWAELKFSDSPPPLNASSQNVAAFSKPKHLELREPGIQFDIRASDDHNNDFAVTLSARHPALYVWLELTGIDAEFSDNFFDLRPASSITVIVRPRTEIRREQFDAALKVRSLFSTWL